MKYIILITVGIFFLISNSKAQNDSIIIDPLLDSIHIVDIPDTLINAMSLSAYCGTSVYTLDVDGNNIPDFTFTAQCSMGGWASYHWIKLISSDSSTFSVNNSVIDSVGHLDTSGIYYSLDTFRMVKIFNLFDILYSNDCIDQNTTNISSSGSNSFPSIYQTSSLDNWISGEHYIGIKKMINGNYYLGWIKVEVLSYSQIIIKEYALYGIFVSVKKYNKTQISIFPNPAKDKLYINNDQQEKREVKIYNMIGERVLLKKLSYGINEFDVSSLPKGIYIIQIDGEGYKIIQKLSKL